MRFIIYGAGGIGCVIGGHLFRQGNEVVLVGNPQHIDKVNENGLKLVTGDESFILNIPAVKTADELVPFRYDDIVLLCAKSQHTVKCLSQLKNAGAPRTLPVFCVQNSILNESVTSRIFDRVYGVMIKMPAIFMTPGEVINPIIRPYGVIEIGCYPRGSDELCEQLAGALRCSGFSADVRSNVMKSKAGKCLINLGNALDAIIDEKGDNSAFVQEIHREAMDVWNAAGIEWESADSFQRRLEVNSGVRIIPLGYDNLEKRSSSWQSLMRQTDSIEAEQLNGDVVKFGKQLGIATPFNELLWHIADEMAHKCEKPGKYRADDLYNLLQKRKVSIEA